MGKHHPHRAAGWLVLTAAGTLLGPEPARADLHEYVKRDEPAYSWKQKDKKETSQGTVYDLHLVSQTWQGIKWEHQLQVYQPKGVAPAKTMLLWNTGGSASPTNQFLALEVAKRVGAPVAFLYHIPNQPLLDGKKEDALIAETFVRYLQTRDASWPLLFPMVKSVVKAMDALQAFSKQEWKQPVEGFIISGGSKRGWTSWLSGAADPRVKAIAPMVIDTLNMLEQGTYQIKSLGKPSEMIGDYVRAGLVPAPKTEEATKLWRMVDPYAYRDQLTLPKLMVNGNNDPYWTTDALNLYWDGLKGDKWVIYVPNAGHDLRQPGAQGLDRAVNGLSAFVRHQTSGKPMPKLSWKHDDADGKLRLTVETTAAPRDARLWVAEAPTRDFRKAEWKERPASLLKHGFTGEVEPPKEGCRAFFGEIEFETDGLRYYLSTQIRIAGTPVPKP